MIKYNDMMNKDVIWILIRVKWGSEVLSWGWDKYEGGWEGRIE